MLRKGAIDIAFVDRADIKQYIGLPSSKARGLILSSCMSELERVGIVRRDEGLGEEAESPEQDHEVRDRGMNARDVLWLDMIRRMCRPTVRFFGCAMLISPRQSFLHVLRLP